MLNWLLSDRIFISKERNVEFFLELFCTHYYKWGDKLISESFTPLSTLGTHHCDLASSGESAILEGWIHSPGKSSDYLALEIFRFLIDERVGATACLGSLLDKIFTAARSHTKGMNSCRVNWGFAQLYNFIRLLYSSISQKKDLFISWGRYLLFDFLNLILLRLNDFFTIYHGLFIFFSYRPHDSSFLDLRLLL